MSWKPDNWEEIVDELGSYSSFSPEYYQGIDAGAEAILEAVLPLIEKEIRAHTSAVSADAIIGSQLWLEMVKQ